MRTPSLRQRWQYFFDNFMSRGTPALLGGLFVLSALIIFVVSALVMLTGSAPEETGFLGLAWMSLLRTLDSGTMGGDTGSPFFLFMMLVVTFGGVFIVSALIGVINNGLEDKLDELRKGRSMVLESDHTVILGWSPQIFTILSELVQANESRKQGAVVAILSDQDKVDMEDEINERIPDTKNTKIICRSGSPIDLTDLEIVSPHAARSVIILPEGADPDTHVIKSVLALTNNPNRREEPYLIVTQIRDPRNMEVVKMLGGRDHLLPILTNDLIARVVAQTSRQSGLSAVYTELMNFGGDEIYFASADNLVGNTYGDALQASEASTIMGLRKKDGTVMMNPPMDTPIEKGDQVFALAEDDDKLALSASAKPSIQEDALRTDSAPRKAAPEKCLIIGWNHSGATIVHELDNYVAEGSQVTVVSDLFNLDKQIQQQAGELKNQKVVIKEGDTTDRALLDELNAPDYDHVIVLAYSHLETQDADAKTLITLLHLRDMAEKDETPFSIVSEMLDLRNRELAEAAKVDDFIVSDHLISLMTTQLSENRELFAVFNDIFDPEGSEIYLKPTSDYVVTGQPVNFATIVEAARRRGETAIGYRLMREMGDAGKAYGVHTNPKKSAMVTFTPEDKVIVISEG
jgi:voltage-gated potassium channel Kch